MSLATLADLVGAMIPTPLLWVVFEASLKGSVLLLVAWALVRGMRTASAALRHLIWASALGGMLVLPLLSSVMPPIDVSGLPRVERDAILPTAPPVIAISDRDLLARLSQPLLPSASPAIALVDGGRVDIRLDEPPRATTLARYIPLVWLGIAALVLLRLVVGTLRVSLWSRRARAVEEGEWLSLAQRMAARLHITRPVTLLRSDRACVPMTWGVVYPTVLLPIDADEWPRDRRMIVLLHELAHVKRFDAFTQLIAQLAVALFWFNPLVWLATRQMRTEREHACDDCVLEGGARPTDYAYDLLQIARSLGGSSAPAAAALAMARPSEFEGRLLAILDPKTNRHSVSRMRLAVATVGVFVLTLPLAALRSAPRQTSIASPVSVAWTTPARDAAPEPIAALLPSPPSRLAIVVLPDVAQRTTEPTPASVDISAMTLAPVAATTPLVDSRIPGGTIVAAPIPKAAQKQQQQQQGQATQPPPDRETLIAVVRQAAKMKSDFDKAELLITVAKHYIRDDELRTAYLDAVGTMRGSYDQSRALLPMMLRDDFPAHAVSQVVKIASQMSSDNDKASLLVTTITDHPALTTSTCDAIIAASATIRSEYDRSRTIAAILKRGELTNGQLVDLIGVIKPISSSFEKANALVNLSRRYALTDSSVRTAFFQAAETITGATEYRRVMQGVLR